MHSCREFTQSFFLSYVFLSNALNCEAWAHAKPGLKRMLWNSRPVPRKDVILNSFETLIFDLQPTESTVSSSALIPYASGLLASLSPCGLSVLPLTTSIMSTEAQGMPADDATQGRILAQMFSFGLGLAMALSLFGLGAIQAGHVFGGIFGGVSTLVPSIVAILGGLVLLDLIDWKLPYLRTGVLPRIQHTDEAIQSSEFIGRAFTLGASSAILTAPCSSPVLASILGTHFSFPSVKMLPIRAP